jgi:hypothetical protein
LISQSANEYVEVKVIRGILENIFFGKFSKVPKKFHDFENSAITVKKLFNK